jgi:hypothetical protein
VLPRLLAFLASQISTFDPSLDFAFTVHCSPKRKHQKPTESNTIAASACKSRMCDKTCEPSGPINNVES